METILNFRPLVRVAIFIIIELLFVSCDPAIGYRYTVDNKSDKELLVYYKWTDEDSVISIQPKTKTVFFDEGMWGSNPHDEKDEFLGIFDSLRIEAKDTIHILVLDYLKRENWTYSNEPSHIGFIETGLNKYEIEINNEDFK